MHPGVFERPSIAQVVPDLPGDESRARAVRRDALDVTEPYRGARNVGNVGILPAQLVGWMKEARCSRRQESGVDE